MTDTPAPTPAPRKRGRPHGSKDSYPRFRSASKLPKPTILNAVLPALRELIDIAELNGYNKISGARTKESQAAVDRALTCVLTNIQTIVNGKEETI